MVEKLSAKAKEKILVVEASTRFVLHFPGREKWIDKEEEKVLEDIKEGFKAVFYSLSLTGVSVIHKDIMVRIEDIWDIKLEKIWEE